MTNRIIMFSGGKGSFAVAHYVKQKYPNDNIVLYFTDTKWEDADLYRFINEASSKLELPMLVHSRGLDPMQHMFEERLVFNNRLGRCSIDLKAKVSQEYIDNGIVPEEEYWVNKQYLKDENIRDNPVIYFGIDFSEAHRKEPIVRNWQPHKVEMPLIDNMIDVDGLLEQYSIKQPRLYDLGFTHNNCAGRCVKAGQGHFKNLYDKMPDVFLDTAEREREISTFVDLWLSVKRDDDLDDETKGRYHDILDSAWRDYFYYRSDAPKELPTELKEHEPIGRKYAFMRKQKDKVRFPYQLFDLKKDIEEDEQIDMFDIGGCGCFVDAE